MPAGAARQWQRCEPRKLRKDELLKIVQQNRKGHKAVVAEAMKNYRKTAIAELERMLADAISGKRSAAPLSWSSRWT
jgi:hypothetical protein